jgi:hypothetical protein
MGLVKNWNETVKYCKFHPRGVGLARRTKLTPAQILLIEKLASEVRMEMTGENISLPLSCLSGLPVTTAGIFYPECKIVRKGDWLVDGDGRPGVIGRVHEEKGIAVLYPNPHVYPYTLSSLLSQSSEPQNVK